MLLHLRKSVASSRALRAGLSESICRNGFKTQVCLPNKRSQAKCNWRHFKLAKDSARMNASNELERQKFLNKNLLQIIQEHLKLAKNRAGMNASNELEREKFLNKTLLQIIEDQEIAISELKAKLKGAEEQCKRKLLDVNEQFKHDLGIVQTQCEDELRRVEEHHEAVIRNKEDIAYKLSNKLVTIEADTEAEKEKIINNFNKEIQTMRDEIDEKEISIIRERNTIRKLNTQVNQLGQIVDGCKTNASSQRAMNPNFVNVITTVGK